MEGDIVKVIADIDSVRMLIVCYGCDFTRSPCRPVAAIYCLRGFAVFVYKHRLIGVDPSIEPVLALANMSVNDIVLAELDGHVLAVNHLLCEILDEDCVGPAVHIC